MQRFFSCLSLYFVCTLLPAQSADTLTFVHFNLMRYGDAGCTPSATKNAQFKIVFDYLKPDILTVNEMKPSTASVNSLLGESLNFNPAMKATVFGNSSNSDLVNMLYYNSTKLGYLSHQVITGNIRDIDIYRLYSRAHTHPGDTVDLYCFVAHLKASQGTDNVNARGVAAQDVVNWLQQHPAIQRFTFSGDFNLYSSNEPAWQNLMQRFVDPTGVSTGWVGASYAGIHTQSPADGSNPCAVTGGMDNRFDFILTSPGIFNASQAVSYIHGTYTAVGNYGNSYNVALNCDVNNLLPTDVCNVFHVVSDHLPVTLKLHVKETVSTEQPAVKKTVFQVFGNPVLDEQIRVQSSIDGLGHWRLINELGSVVSEGASVLQANAFLTIPVSILPVGLYWLQIAPEQGKAESLKVLIGR